LSKWIFDHLKLQIPGIKEVSVMRETVGLKVTYWGDDS